MTTLAEERTPTSGSTASSQLQQVVDAADLGTWTYDLAARTLRWSERCARLTELPPGPVDSRSFFGCLPPDDRKRVRQALQQAVRNGGTDDFAAVYRVIATHSRAQRWVLARGRVQRNQEGEALQVCGIALDVTDLKENEARLSSLTEKLRASNAELEQFAEIVSHDLREPLRMICVFTKLVSTQYGEALPAEAREFLQFAVGGAERLRDVVDGLMQIAYVASGEVALQLYPLADLAEIVRHGLRQRLTEQEVHFEFDPLPKVLCEPVLLQSVLRRLLLLILDANPAAHAVIRLDVLDKGPRWEVTIGCSRATATQPTEDPFRSVLPGQKDAFGFALCRKIVEKHGGRLWSEQAAHSPPRFGFTLSRK